MNYAELLSFLAPEALTVLAALGVLFNDVTVLRADPYPVRMRWAAWLTVFASVVGILAVSLTPQSTPAGYAGGMLETTPLTQLIKVVLLVLLAATALISAEFRFTDHVGEYFALLLLATVGGMFMISSGNVLLIFVSLELLSLSLYVLTAFNKGSVRSGEAGLKYFLFGGISAAFLLFGLSLLYGLSGELDLRRMAAKLVTIKADPLLIVGMLGVFVGLGFKIAAVPFHLWAPDTYQGAPLPSAAFIASASKVASFFVLARLMMAGFNGAEGSGAWSHFETGWVPILAVGAALSVMAGNLAAIAQTSVRRLLAYSAVAHAGYMLIGILAAQKAEGMASLLYYAVTYGVTAVGAFAVVGIVQARQGSDHISSFAGLGKRSPVLAVCLMLFLLSMAGIPPLAGFFGKFYLFKAALFEAGPSQSNGLLWLVILAIAMSAVSLYYYLQVLKQVFVVEPPEDEPRIQTEASTLWVVAFGGLVVVVLGCLPNLLVSQLVAAVQAAGF
jgi:NADH-quinone oxidoreductase subunit N